MSEKVTAVIPVRLGSTRLPRKALADINGRPLLWHVWKRVSQADTIDQTIIATDSSEVLDVVETWGGRGIFTSPDCQCGTERIASILDQLAGEFILNVQGDEVQIDPALLDWLVSVWFENPVDLITPIYPITSQEDLMNPNIVKVARAHDGRAVYFSRSPVPYLRDEPVERWLERRPYWGHIGVYGYRRAALQAYLKLPESPLETAERLEQLRFIEAGYAMYTVEASYHPLAVDTYEDLDRARELLAERD
jgi:3-deoxy-manno-octulosonate cytidylyltransferase (CMP-KDO synthetase)